MGARSESNRPEDRRRSVRTLRLIRREVGTEAAIRRLMSSVAASVALVSCSDAATAPPPLPRIAATYDMGATQLLSIAPVDLLGDAHADLVMVARSDLTVRVLPGTANGAFGDAVAIPAESDAFQAAVGDVNGDGVADLLVIGHDNAFNVRLGTGNGRFGEPTRYALRNHGSKILVADLDGDGYDDVVAEHDGSGQPIYVSTYRGSASGALQKVGDIPTPYFTAFGIAAGDFDGDGKLDVALVTSDVRAAVLVFRGLGTGGLADPVAFPSLAPPGSGGDGAGGIAVGDLNRDGRDDIVTVHYGLTNQVVVRLADGGGFAAPEPIALPSPIGVALGDFDGDGTLDVAATNLDAGTLSLLRGRGDGTFDAPRSIDLGTAPTFVASADFDGDGLADLAVTGVSDGKVRVLLSRRR